jgi:hypothetical protein
VASGDLRSINSSQSNFKFEYFDKFKTELVNISGYLPGAQVDLNDGKN